MGPTGKNLCLTAVLAIGLWLAMTAGSADAAAGQANARDACSGQHCSVRSLRNGAPRASFPVCTGSWYGVEIFDLDAGVPRRCQLDGGWSEIGGASGAAGFFYDAGLNGFSVSSHGYIRTDEKLIGPADAGPLQAGVYVNAEAEAFAVGNYLDIGFSARPYLGLHYGPTFNSGTLHGALALPGSSGHLEVWAPSRLMLRAGGSVPSGGTEILRATTAGLVLPTATANLVDFTGDARLEFRNSGLTAATATSTVPAFAFRQVIALDTGDPIFAVCHGAGCTYDFVVPYGAAAQALSGLRIGDSSSFSVSQQRRGTLVNPPSCGASTTTDTAMTFATAPSDGATCRVGVPGVALQAGLMLSCFVGAASTVYFRCLNVTGGGLTPPAGTYSCLCDE